MASLAIRIDGVASTAIFRLFHKSFENYSQLLVMAVSCARLR